MNDGMVLVDGSRVPSRVWWYLKRVADTNHDLVYRITGGSDINSLNWFELARLWKTLTGIEL